ncbi:MAG: hypothetical protein FH749_06895 [Firmicutes bacterium]|nr:hypothetical protein [Bacillota bacterium]
MTRYRRILTGEPVPVAASVPPGEEQGGKDGQGEVSPAKSTVAATPQAPRSQAGNNHSRLADPRPDLPDSELYQDLLMLALANDAKAKTPGKLLGAFHGMRCAGTALEQTPKGGYKLRPVVGEEAWPSEADYRAACKKYLDPIRQEVLSTLKSLRIRTGEVTPWQAR